MEEHLERLPMVGELLGLVWQRRGWWMLPPVAALLLIVVLIVLSLGSALGPSVYPLF
jgi:Family of unknown function (DUF5989)